MFDEEKWEKEHGGKLTPTYILSSPDKVFKHENKENKLLGYLTVLENGDMWYLEKEEQEKLGFSRYTEIIAYAKEQIAKQIKVSALPLHNTVKNIFKEEQ